MKQNNYRLEKKYFNLNQASLIISACLIYLVISVSYAASNGCSSGDSSRIKQQINAYVVKNSVVNSGFSIETLKCKQGYATAQVKQSSTDEATVFLHKVGDCWQVLSLGTDFDEPFLRQIPPGLYQQ